MNKNHIVLLITIIVIGTGTIALLSSTTLVIITAVAMVISMILVILHGTGVLKFRSQHKDSPQDRDSTQNQPAWLVARDAKDLEKEGLRKWAGKHKLNLALSTAAIAVVILVIVLGIAEWYFSMKIEGTWMASKAGVNIWDIYFQQGYYWKAFWVIPVVWIASDPFFWRKRATMRLLFDMFETDIKKSKFIYRAAAGLALICIRAVIGFFVGWFSASTIANQWLLINAYLKPHGLTLTEFVTKNYLNSILYWFTGNLPTADYLVKNTIVFDFMNLLNTVLVPVLIYWTIKLAVTAIYAAKKDGNAFPAIANTFTGLSLWYLYLEIMMMPNDFVDITAKVYVPWKIPTLAVFAAFALIFNIASIAKPVQVKVNRHKFILATLAIVLIVIVLAAPILQAYGTYNVSQQYAAKKNEFQFPYEIAPHISYVNWSNVLNSIKSMPIGSITAPPQFEETLLQNIRVISYTAAINLMQQAYGTSVGQPWMQLSLETQDNNNIYGPMIIWVNNHEYWVDTTSPVLPEVSDTDVAARFQYTHSEVILAVDAATGAIVPITQVFPQVNSSTLAMYYGIGGLFQTQDMVFLNFNRYNNQWNEIHLASYKGPSSYNAEPDYAFGNSPMPVLPFVNERQWYFGWKGLDWWSYGSGQYGTDISVLFHRDVTDRIKSLLIDGLKIEVEPSTGGPIPYFVVDSSGNVYYAFAIYMDKSLNTGYADTKTIANVATTGDFRRLFAILLVNTHDGTIQGYRYGNWEENYITQYFANYYPSWNKEMPNWIAQQIRYPKDLMYDYVDLFNTYHIGPSDIQDWYSSRNFFDFPTDKSGKYFGTQFDDIRYIPVYYNGTLQYAAVRLVELYQQQSTTWIPRKVSGIYIFFGNGDKYFATLQTENVQSLQLMLDSISTNRDIQYILTTTQQHAQQWQEGNLLLYIIAGKPVFFVPYYTITGTITKVTMIVAIDGSTLNVGYYQLSANPTADEVQLAIVRAYTAMAHTMLATEEQRINVIQGIFEKSNIQVAKPEIVNPMIGEIYATANFTTTQDAADANATLNNFIQTVVVPNNITTVYMWTTTTTSGSKVIHIGALLPNFVMEIIEITIS